MDFDSGEHKFNSNLKPKTMIYENVNIFRCPLCFKSMHLVENKSLKCSNKHCFDISKNRYINFLTTHVKPGYNRAMFEARRELSETGFFDGMTKIIGADILEHIKHKKEPVFILDAGCGEGSHLSNIVDNLRSNITTPIIGAGIDISKEAINIASRYRKDILWAVADLAKIPFLDKKFDVVLNVLSPSNYVEFKRVLKDDGIFIKVVPDSDYLKELRKIFYGSTFKASYSNEKVVSHLANNLKIIGSKRAKYKAYISGKHLNSVIDMTPLSWGVSEEELNKARNSQISSITVDLTIITAKKH